MHSRAPSCTIFGMAVDGQHGQGTSLHVSSWAKALGPRAPPPQLIPERGREQPAIIHATLGQLDRRDGDRLERPPIR